LEITVLAAPRLRSSHVMLADHMLQTRYDAVFLMFSRELEEFVRTLAEGFTYNRVIDEIRKLKLVPEPVGAWEYYAEPILKTLSHIKRRNPNLDIYCYESPSYCRVSAEITIKLTLLTYRALATGKIEAAKWRSIVSEQLKLSHEAVGEDAEFIMNRAEEYGRSVCTSGLSGNVFERIFLERGTRTDLLYLNIPYHLKPLEMLEEEVRREVGESVTSDDRVEELVKCHLDFIKRYVLLSSNPDEAYYRWVRNEVPWLRLQEQGLGKT